MAFDYVIVGAGSAGCAMAYRLSEAGKRVCIIEHGGSDTGPFIQMPAALYLPMNMKIYDWGFKSEAEPHLGGRSLACPRGKVIGGSSSINGMVYVRGHPRDYDFWDKNGADGWAWQDVAPYFKRMENWHAQDKGCDDRWRGKKGPLHISQARAENPLLHAFLQSAQEAGYPLTDDYNGYQQEGFGRMDATIWRGQRWSCARAYLRPALKSGKVRLIRAFAHEVVFDNNKACGVLIQKGQHQQVIKAGCEVILCASAINSPKLLLLSGIGPADDLNAHGIKPRVHRAGVGKNLQDHLEVYLQFKCLQNVTLAKYWNIFSKGFIGFQWLTTKTGVGASNHFEVGAFLRSRAGVEYPDIQFHFLPIAVRYDGQKVFKGHGFQVHMGPMRSPSRGWVKLASANPIQPPKIFFNYMSEEKDWEVFRTSIRLAREILSQESMKNFMQEEHNPGAQNESDEALDDFVRKEAESAYHPCGTCRMGRKDDPMAVVDPEGCVIGVKGLRVADSSIFPQITNGNLNAPSIMVGEKIADKILGRAPLSHGENSFWINPNWKTRQR